MSATKHTCNGQRPRPRTSPPPTLSPFPVCPPDVHLRLQISLADRAWYSSTFAGLFNALSPDYSLKVGAGRAGGCGLAWLCVTCLQK